MGIVALQGQYKGEQAKTIVKRIRMLYPSDVTLMVKEGEIQWFYSSKTEAKKTFRQVLTLDPQNTTATYYLNLDENASGETAPHAKRNSTIRRRR